MGQLSRHITAMAALLVLILECQAPCWAATPPSDAPSLDQSIEQWDKAFTRRLAYQQRRKASLDSLKMEVRKIDPTDAEEMSYGYHELASRYAGYDADSALLYFDRAAESSRDLGGQHSVILAESCLELAISDVLGEAIDRFESVVPSNITSEPCLSKYYYVAYQLFNYVRMNARIDSLRVDAYEHASAARDSLLSKLPDNSPLYYYLSALKSEDEEKTHQAIASCHTALLLLGRSDRMYSPVAETMARLYKKIDRNNEWVSYTVEAAISQVERGDTYRDYILRLSKLFYEIGEEERAANCLDISMSDALNSGAIVSAMNAADDYQRIGLENTAKIRTRNRQLVILVAVLSAILLLWIAIGIWRAYSRRKRLKLEARIRAEEEAFAAASAVEMPEIETKVGEETLLKPAANSILDVLHLFDNCMERFESFQRLAKRKISAGQVKDLYRMLVSGKIGAEQSQIFFEIFDNSFLRYYPTFVDEINRLLKPGKQISIDEKGHLTNELRIYALMCLGIEDGQRVSRLLGVSVSTVYTYRNKMRLRAVDRDTFEESVRQIQSSPSR